MENRDAFASCHPVVNLMYFVCVIGFALAFNHPLCLGISFISAFVYSGCLRGKKGIKKNIIYMLPLIVLTAILNPAFSHQGVTILTYLPSGNPLTLEAILYGIAAAFMLVTVMAWFGCFNRVMTSDKFVYLFGRIAPVLSLILSMTLRFIPDFTEQFGKVYRSRRAAGYGGKNEKNPIKKILANISEGLHVTSTVVTWSLERAIVTSDSMKARGYGLKKRTAYSIFSMDKRDVCCLIYILLTGLYVLAGAVYGSFDFWYYPCILTKTPGLYEDSVFICYGMLAAMPIVMHVYEVKKWKIIESKK